MAVHVFKILQKENVKVTHGDVLLEYVNESYPDLRKVLQNVEANVYDGVLHEAMSTDDNAKLLVDIVEQLSAGNWLDVRATLVSNIAGDEWDALYRFLYDNLDQVTGFDLEENVVNWKQGILTIANHVRFHGQVADPEINFSACMINLSGIVK